MNRPSGPSGPPDHPPTRPASVDKAVDGSDETSNEHDGSTGGDTTDTESVVSVVSRATSVGRVANRYVTGGFDGICDSRFHDINFKFR